MRTSIAVALLAVFSAPGALWACGDKFFQVSMSGRGSQIYAARYPSNIIIYAAAASDAGKQLRDRRLLTSFKRARHNVELVETSAALERALQSGQVDLVFTDYDTALALRHHVTTAPGSPSLLGAESAAKRKGKAAPAPPPDAAIGVVKVSDKIIGLLTKVDDELKRRKKSGVQQAKS